MIIINNILYKSLYYTSINWLESVKCQEPATKVAGVTKAGS